MRNIALVKKLDEYIAYLGKAALESSLHGGCSDAEFRVGERLRQEIKELRGKTRNNSGVLDKNGVDICAGDVVEVVINIQYQQPVIQRWEIIYYRGAFRFKNDREAFQPCIGDVASNCTLEIIAK